MMILLTWLHLLAAVAWIGGMLFLSLVVTPVLKCEPFAAERGILFRAVGHRFRMLVWGSVVVLVSTGPWLMIQRGLPLSEPSGWPPVLLLKLTMVVLLLALTASHDFVIGPRVVDIRQRPDQARTPRERVLVASSAWLPRLSLLLALCVLIAAVALART